MCNVHSNVPTHSCEVFDHVLGKCSAMFTAKLQRCSRQSFEYMQGEDQRSQSKAVMRASKEQTNATGKEHHHLWSSFVVSAPWLGAAVSKYEQSDIGLMSCWSCLSKPPRRKEGVISHHRDIIATIVIISVHYQTDISPLIGNNCFQESQRTRDYSCRTAGWHGIVEASYESVVTPDLSRLWLIQSSITCHYSNPVSPVTIPSLSRLYLLHASCRLGLQQSLSQVGPGLLVPA